MGGDRPALRGVAGLACIVAAILVWEGIEGIVLKHGSSREQEDVWRSAGQFQAGGPGKSVGLESAESAERVNVDSSSPSPKPRQCLIGTFLRGTQGLENNVYSQNGEDGIIEKIWDCIGPANKTYVEIGVTDSSSCVSRNLKDKGWSGLILGSGQADPEINLKPETPNADNVISILDKHSTPLRFDQLTLHLDLDTFWVLQAMLQGGFQPRVIAARINRNFHPGDTLVAPYDAKQKFQGTTHFGAAAGAFDALFEQVGFRTVAIDQAQGSVYAVGAADAGQPRLLSMAEVAAGVVTVPLCQGEQTCSGKAEEWLDIDANAAPMLGMPRKDWYSALPRWTVQCVPVTRAVGSNQMLVGVPAGAGALREYHAGVLSLVPCGRVADNTALADVIVAAQAGAPRNGSGEAAADAGNGTECRQHADVVAEQRECVRTAFLQGSTPHETRRYSQYYEDGIIDGIFACIKPYDKYYVEFGVEDGAECTTRHLREDGWRGLMMDGGFFRPEINLQQEFFNAEGIAWQFNKHSVPQRFDHLTIDIDQNTFWVLHAILIAGFRPRLIVAEINRNFHFNDTMVVPYDYHQMWIHTSLVFGAGPGAFDKLFEAFGYHTVTMDQDQVNIFAVHSCEVGAERLFSSDELVQGLQRVGPCAGIHTCGDGEFREMTAEVEGMLTRPHYEWIDKMPRWWVACSEPPTQPDPARTVRLMTGKPIGSGGAMPVVPRFPAQSVTKDRCAPITVATAEAEELSNA